MLTVRTGMDRDQVVVVIGDTGPGVPAEIRDRIFDPLFTTKPVGEGTGLGLDVTWRIVVNNHHGDIQVESVPGEHAVPGNGCRLADVLSPEASAGPWRINIQ